MGPATEFWEPEDFPKIPREVPKHQVLNSSQAYVIESYCKSFSDPAKASGTFRELKRAAIVFLQQATVREYSIANVQMEVLMCAKCSLVHKLISVIIFVHDTYST